MNSKPEWHQRIVHSLQTEKKSVQWLVTKPANCNETFQLLHDLADLPNVLISGKSFSSIKTMIMKAVDKKQPIDSLVIVTKRVESHTIRDLLVQLSNGLLLDCRVRGKECQFDPFNVLIICDAYPPIHVVEDIGVKVSFINDYDRQIFVEACSPSVFAM